MAAKATCAVRETEGVAVVLPDPEIRCTVPHCRVLHCTVLQHFIALHCTALYSTVLHYTTWHYTILCGIYVTPYVPAQLEKYIALVLKADPTRSMSMKLDVGVGEQIRATAG
jgi:hypothetical protein